MWEYVAILKQKQMDWQEDYTIKHTEVDESNTKTVKYFPKSVPLEYESPNVHTHLNNGIWYVREDDTVWSTKIWSIRHTDICQPNCVNIKKG